MDEKPEPAAEPDPRWLALAQALIGLRDALTEVSLNLQDFSFEHDVAQRLEAQRLAQQLEQRIRKPLEH